jgi:hypothetical protein
MKNVHGFIRGMSALALAVVVLIACGLLYASGPPRPYSILYLIAYKPIDGGCNHPGASGWIIGAVQNSSVHRIVTPVGGDCSYAPALVVYDKVRTIPGWPGNIGAEYGLFLKPTGKTYNYENNLQAERSGGTTDGTYNYLGSYFGQMIYRLGLEWENPVPLFPVPFYPGGVTYDSTDDTLWVVSSEDLDGSVVNHYTKTGALLSSLNIVVRTNQQPIGLALDPATQTLWLGRNDRVNPSSTIPVLEEYTKTGQLVGRLSLPSLKGYWFANMQFRVPHKF